MKRAIYMSQLKADGDGLLRRLPAESATLTEALRAETVLTTAWFRHDRWLFGYFEAANDDWSFVWPERYTEYLETWPGGSALSHATPMLDIFHDQSPRDAASWRSGHTPERRLGSLARLKPEWYASYVYYHYQLQEERPGHFNKYYTIGACGRLLFSYSEQPAVIGGAPPGKLATAGTPDDWHGTMQPHFETWPDAQGNSTYWLALGAVYSF